MAQVGEDMVAGESAEGGVDRGRGRDGATGEGDDGAAGVDPSGTDRQTLPPHEQAGSLLAEALAVLGAHWRPPGYSVPNAATYPHQWLWDSCFHAVVWAQGGEIDRALAELRSLFANQGPDGFVPHLTYWSDPGAAEEFWGRPATSCITQPPMYGHALAEMARRGVDPPDDLVDAAHAGLAHLLEARREGGAGGVRIVHPWESGCDDSPRWDRWCPPGWTPQAWRTRKGTFVAELVDRGESGFAVEPASFSALVAFNARELVTLRRRPAADARLLDAADELAAVLADRWDRPEGTWVDVDPSGAVTSRARTLDPLVAALVVDDASQCTAALDQLVDPSAFGARFGPAGVHAAEPARDPDRYWRGPAWPQLSYLLWVAARRWGHPASAVVADGLVGGAMASGWGEFWNPDTATTTGAAPQSWTGLAAVVAASAPGGAGEPRQAGQQSGFSPGG